MPNCYVNLGTVKAVLGITNAEWDTQLLRTAEDASREFDRDTDRFYYIYEGTFYQDGGSTRVILDWDVQTVSTLIIDINGENQYPTTSAYTVDINSPTTAPDALMYPQNSYPKTRLEANPFGGYGHLGSSFRKAIKITGTFGHGNDWPAANTHTAASITGATLTSTDTALSVSASTASEFSGGMTLRIGSEQIFINAAPAASSCPITRAQNGTTAASATTGTVISIYDYPQPVVQATLIAAVRAWKRRESGFVNTIINTDMGSVQVFKGTDPDYQRIVTKYKKVRSGKYIN